MSPTAGAVHRPALPVGPVVPGFEARPAPARDLVTTVAGANEHGPAPLEELPGGVDLEEGPDPIQKSPDGRRRQEAGRATTEIDRSQGSEGMTLGGAAKLSFESLHVRLHQAIEAGVGVEVAVTTLVPAKR